jgi:hypothetical protein
MLKCTQCGYEPNMCPMCFTRDAFKSQESSEDQERMRETLRVCDGVPTIVLQGMETGGMAWLLRKTIQRQ